MLVWATALWQVRGRCFYLWAMVRETRRGRARAAGSSVRVRSRCLSWLGKSRLGSYRVLKGDLRLRYGLGYATQSGGPQNQVNRLREPELPGHPPPRSTPAMHPCFRHAGHAEPVNDTAVKERVSVGLLTISDGSLSYLPYNQVRDRHVITSCTMLFWLQ